jgi:SH3-like domain-containing protein
MVRLNDGDIERINLRAGPGTNYPVVGQFTKEDTAKATGQNESNDWWQIDLENDSQPAWVLAELVALNDNVNNIPIVETPTPPPTPTITPTPEATDEPSPENTDEELTPEKLAETLRCGKDFCVTYQTMLSMSENGGCLGNHSIYITVLQGLPPGKPMDGVVIGDTYNNVEVGSGSHGPGTTEITLWSNSMTLIVKRHMDGTPYTSEESFNFTSNDELIPPEVLAAGGYCEGDVEKCRWAHQHNQVCRGHYSWRVTFHKLD